MKKILQKILFILAKKVIEKYKPVIIGVTGSIGKTSTREYAKMLIAHDIDIHSSMNNFNNEFGLPRTILNYGCRDTGYISVLLNGIKQVFGHGAYANYLLLEYGSDKPGDIAYLCSIAQPYYVIITGITDAHRAAYKKYEDLYNEKLSLARCGDVHGKVIINSDLVKTNQLDLHQKIEMYGTSSDCDLRLLDYSYDTEVYTTKIKIDYKGSVIPFSVPLFLSKGQIYSLLGGIMIALVCGVTIVHILKRLSELQIPQGRGNLVCGENQICIIDDSYNASTQSMLSSIELLTHISKKLKVAILGDMKELGDSEKDAYTLIRERLMNAKLDIVVLVGPKMKTIFDAVGNVKNWYWFISTKECLDHLMNIVPSENSCVLIKGSRTMELDRITEILIKQ